MDRFAAMRVFVKIAETGGFAEAARQLSMSPPAVTRAVAALEDLVAARLLVRSTRSLKLTDVGERYLEDCRRILGDLAQSEAAAAGSHGMPSGRLVVTAPVLFGQIYVLPLLADFLIRHPEVSGQAVFLDRLVNVVEEGFDIAVRIGHLADSELNAVRVGAVSRVVCAAPDYLETQGEPSTPADLAGHAIIASSTTGTTRDWRFGSDRKTVVSIKPRLFCNLNEASIEAACTGLGITRVLSYQVAAALREGRLCKILGAFEEAPLPIQIVHAGGRRPSAKIRAFVDLAVATLRADEALGFKA